jgi:hypothetical protein
LIRVQAWGILVLQAMLRQLVRNLSAVEDSPHAKPVAAIPTIQLKNIKREDVRRREAEELPRRCFRSSLEFYSHALL